MTYCGELQSCDGPAAGVRSPGLRAWLVWVFVVAMMLAMSPARAQRMDLSDDQKQKLKTLASDVRTRVEAQRHALKRARVDLMGAYHEYKLDEKRSRAAIAQVGDAQKTLLDIQMDNQVRIRQVLTADQFEQFQKLMSKMMRGFGLALALPMEEEALEMGLGPDVCDKLNLSDDQQKRLDRVKRAGGKKPEVITRLRQSAEQLADVYSKYELDTKAARRLSDAVHRDQVGLTWIAHKSQQAIRGVVNEDQFGQIQQEIDKKLKNRRAMHKRYYMDHGEQH